jgi:hypothetical protein
MWRKHNPACPCCETESICLIQSNDLTSDADLDNNFTLSDGTKFSYHTAPFDAIQVSAASETATANTPHPQSPYPPRVQIEFYGDNIGSQPRIILGGKIVAQVTVGDDCSQLDILNESDDSEICQTLWMPGIDRNEWHRLIVCYDPDTGVVKATVTDLTTSQSYDLSCEYSGDALDATAAFGTGPDHVDNVYVRNFRFWRLWYCGEPPYTSDCHILGDAWDYYYDLPERQYCYHCNTSCTIASHDFTTMDDGDMPCDWDADATDWEIADGQATGNGEVCHKWDGTGGSYNVSATFDLGHLETQGDSVTVSLTSGDVTHSLTVTRVAGANPGDPDRLKYDWVPTDFDSSYGTLEDGSVTLRICSRTVCNDFTTALVPATVTPGAFCVSITQPTMAGHTDAGMTAFSITKSKEMDDDCPECDCKMTCETYCKDAAWPSSWMVELEGLEGYCCDADAMNRAYYVDHYKQACYSYGWGDDGLGVCLEDMVDPPPPSAGTPTNECFWGAYTVGINTYQQAGWFLKGGCVLPSYITSSFNPSNPTWEDFFDDGQYEVTYISVRLYSRAETHSFTDFLWWGFWDEIQPSPANADATHAIVVTVSRLVTVATGWSGWTFRVGSVSASYAKKFSSITDCQNLTDEELPFVLGLHIMSGGRYMDYATYTCVGHPHPAYAYFYGNGPDPHFVDPDFNGSASSVKLTAL